MEGVNSCQLGSLSAAPAFGEYKGRGSRVSGAVDFGNHIFLIIHG